jgi:aryl-alcohol dehydrogenase-like predicted oxidoreductase
MGMTPIYATPDPGEAIATIHAAVDAGITMIDTADMYAGGKNEALVGRALEGIRDRVFLASKFGNMRLPDGTRKVNGKPEYVFAACDKALARMGVDFIDLYYLHRMDPTVPIEDTVGAMAQLIEQGKVGAIGLSEAGANTIRRAQTMHPLAAVQTEYSLASRDVEAEILPTCRELGIGFVAYAPLSRGLLSGEISSLDQLGENDRRRDMPRFQGDNLETNLAMVKAVADIAAGKGVSTAAISIAWVLAQGDDVVPIPGCSRRQTLQDSLTALEVQLSADELASIEAALDAERIIGTRYPEQQMARLGI